MLAGVASIAALVLVFGWMAQHFIASPAPASLAEETPTGFVYSSGLNVEAEEVVRVPFGETATLDDLTRGDRYEIEASSYLQDDFDAQSDAERKALTESEYWDYECAPCTVRVVACSLVSQQSFGEWYPLHEETNVSEPIYAPEDTRFVVVDVEVENIGSEPMAAPEPVLRSAAFTDARNRLNVGLLVDDAALGAMYPLEGDGLPVGLDGAYGQLKAGERRVIRYPFAIYRSTFQDADGIDGARLEDMEIAYFDWNPRRIIALELTDAHGIARQRAAGAAE